MSRRDGPLRRQSTMPKRFPVTDSQHRRKLEVSHVDCRARQQHINARRARPDRERLAILKLYVENSPDGRGRTLTCRSRSFTTAPKFRRKTKQGRRREGRCACARPSSVRPDNAGCSRMLRERSLHGNYSDDKCKHVPRPMACLSCEREREREKERWVPR